MYGGFAFGWLLILLTTFVINHFDLVGLRQVWRHLQGQPQSGLRFVTPLLYRVISDLEERDLIKEHPEYATYRKQVPMLVPSWPRQVAGLNKSAATRGVTGARV